MADPSVQQLFRQWRGGDAEAGKVMAQKFSDWYYAVTTVRVADRTGREPLERACQAFAQGIISVTRPSTLVDWAHDLLERELQTIGRGLDAGPSAGGDHPNALTKNQSPTELVQRAAAAVEPAQLRLLATAFDRTASLGALEDMGDDMGGLPFALLDARYALKRSLQASAEVPFAVVPTQADMDRAPIGLYEAGRLASEDEVATLEKWLLTDIDLCKDVAEFSAFVHAMRDGALSAHGVPAQPPVTTKPQDEAFAPKGSPPEEDVLHDPEDDLLRDPEDDLLHDPEHDLLHDPDDDALVAPDELDLEAQAPAAPAPAAIAPADEPHPVEPSTLSSVIWIAVIMLAGAVLLLLSMLYLLRG